MSPVSFAADLLAFDSAPTPQAEVPLTLLPSWNAALTDGLTASMHAVKLMPWVYVACAVALTVVGPLMKSSKMAASRLPSR